ncbi:hypothetical protein BpHYR1_017123 [Brachionus plicatilis]|uniref:Uncharacterized protein n=1 Tax=Brachionus plicatilis TaxID=10195 RepID=A0A3M7S659_BRAPC|nr:hypothetical protein BpHYR1_017123 [Brachionus plicatilis]
MATYFLSSSISDSVDRSPPSLRGHKSVNSGLNWFTVSASAISEGNIFQVVALRFNYSYHIISQLVNLKIFGKIKVIINSQLLKKEFKKNLNKQSPSIQEGNFKFTKSCLNSQN